MTKRKRKLDWTDFVFAFMGVIMIGWLIIVVHFIVKWW